MKYNNPKLQQALADRYVVGLMAKGSRQRFERLMRHDGTLRRRVNLTEQRWNRLAYAVPPVVVPDTVWDGIQQRLFTANELDTHRQQRRQNTLISWRGWAIAASFVCCVMAGYLFTQHSTPPVQSYIAVINNTNQQAAWYLKIDPAGQSLKVEALSRQALPANRTFELWMIPDNNPTPVSLGLLRPDGITQLQQPTDLFSAFTKPAVYAITIEPIGGSPTGQPTTTPVYSGDILRTSL